MVLNFVISDYHTLMNVSCIMWTVILFSRTTRPVRSFFRYCCLLWWRLKCWSDSWIWKFREEWISLEHFEVRSHFPSLNFSAELLYFVGPTAVSVFIFMRIMFCINLPTRYSTQRVRPPPSPFWLHVFARAEMHQDLFMVLSNSELNSKLIPLNICSGFRV